METAGQRLRRARKAAGFKSSREAAQELDFRVSTLNSHERAGEPGARNFDADYAKRYARAFNVSAAWLLTAEGSMKRQNVARVMGRIGAGAQIDPDIEQVPPDGLYEIEVPFPLPEEHVAFEVDGNSMWPRYDPGDVVICWRFGNDPETIVGWEAAVRTEEQRRYLKRIVRGPRPRIYDLESLNQSTPPMRSVKLEWAAQVSAVVRAGEWKLLAPITAKRRPK